MGNLEGRDQSVWIGTNGGGLNRLKDGRFTHYHDCATGLPATLSARSLRTEPGRCGSERPTDSVAQSMERSITFTVEDGLSSNAVWAIEEDAEGNLWIGTLGD